MRAIPVGIGLVVFYEINQEMILSKFLDKKVIGALAGLMLMTLSGTANAIPLFWEFSAKMTLVLGSDDKGIDGETFTARLTFDDTNTWQDNGPGFLNFVPESATFTISDGTPASFAVLPALRDLENGNTQIADGEANSTNAFLTIDGSLFDIAFFWGPNTIDPTVGDNLVLGHLPTSIDGISIAASTALAKYTFSEESVTAGVVPIPGAVWLMGSGLVGLMGYSRKKRAQVTV